MEQGVDKSACAPSSSRFKSSSNASSFSVKGSSSSSCLFSSSSALPLHLPDRSKHAIWHPMRTMDTRRLDLSRHHPPQQSTWSLACLLCHAHPSCAIVILPIRYHADRFPPLCAPMDRCSSRPGKRAIKSSLSSGTVPPAKRSPPLARFMKDAEG